MPSQLPLAVAPEAPLPTRGRGWLAHTGSDVLAGLVRAAVSLLDAPLGVVTVGEAGAQRLLARAGVRPASEDGRTLSWVEDLCERVVAEDRPMALSGAADAPDWRIRVVGPGLEVFLGAPVRAQGRAVGALAVLGASPRAWTEAEVDGLCGLAAAVGAELERAELEAERELLGAVVRESESRYARLIQNSYMGIYATDALGRLTELNPAAAEILGRPLPELLGRDFRELVAPEDRDLAERLFQQRLGGIEDLGEFELSVVRPTGERRLLQISAAPVLGEGGVVGTHGVARDITDERSREMQFRRAERMASVAPLLSGVCHELNNPLTSIKSFAELLLLDERSPEDREALQIVQREAHRAAKIVTDLRLVARQSQETGTERGMVDLSEVVRHVFATRGDTLSGLEVHLDLGARLPHLWAVRPHVEQVVTQLVANAAQAMQDQAGPRELRIRTYAGGIGLVLQVEDSGPGIPRDQLDRIFDPFWTTRSPGEGTGLGLSMVNGIVMDHGGLVRVDSIVGQGTRFAVEFPIAEQSLMTQGSAEVDSSSSRPLRVLVVDDEAAIRYSLTRYLERRGHRVHQACEGGAALELLEQAGDESYDVIVADLRMPGLNGGELLRRLRARQGALEERLIFITGDADVSDLPNGVDRSGIPVVQKPFELAEIAQIIETQAGITAL